MKLWMEDEMKGADSQSLIYGIERGESHEVRYRAAGYGEGTFYSVAVF